MTSQSFTDARRELRAKRAQDALGLRVVPSELKFRDVLLPDLALATVVPELRSQVDVLVDAAVSVGAARGEERLSDQLSAVFIATEILAQEGQFARLRSMAGLFREFGQRSVEDRPYLAAVLVAFALLLEGRRTLALQSLNEVLGLGSSNGSPYERVSPSWNGLGEVYLANALRMWIREGTQVRLEQIRTYSGEVVDGLLFAAASMLYAYSKIVQEFSVSSLVPLADPTFDTPQLQSYLQRRQISTLFPAQANAIASGVLDKSNTVLAMPTSSGKTFIAELRILSALAANPDERAIYLAPYRVLANQVAEAMHQPLSGVGLRVKDLGSAFDATGGFEFNDEELPNVAVMTFERLDSFLRLAGSGRKGDETATELLESCRLLIIDELQLISRANRGPKLEMIIARVRQRLPDTPILALAAMPINAENLANWIDAKEVVPPFGRPSGLIEMVWKPDGSIYQRFEGGQYKVAEIPRPGSGAAIDAAASLITRFQRERLPILFVETVRDYAESVVKKAASLSPRHGDRWRRELSSSQRGALDRAASLADAMLGQGNALGDLIRQGLAFHHAGVPPRLLREIEDLTRKGALRAIGATTTVAEGADLPFRSVVIPHLNFGGQQSRLDRDLYNNIVGRSGRINSTTEGLVLIIGSDSPSLRNHVERILWRDDAPRSLTGKLADLSSTPVGIEEYRAKREVESQILAWIGDSGSYVEHQSSFLASSTFTWQSANQPERDRLVQLFDDVTTELEVSGLAEAASPFKLTALGHRSRLAGLGIRSCKRIGSRASQLSESGIFDDLMGVTKIESEVADLIANLLLESEEVIEWSLWFRKTRQNDQESLSLLNSLASGELNWPYEDAIYQSDSAMLSSWMQGKPYIEIGGIPPIFGGRGLFGSDDPAKRAADAAEHFARISYPAAWSWGATVGMLGESGDRLPAFIRDAVEFGLPTESAVELVRTYGISRHGAVLLSELLPSMWALADSSILDFTQSDLRSIGLTDADRQMIWNELD